MTDAALELLAEGAMTVPQAADFCGFGKTTLYAEMDAGRLPYVRYGTARRIPKRALIRWMAGHLVAYRPDGDESQEARAR